MGLYGDSTHGEERVEEKKESARVECLRWGIQRSQSGSRTGIRVGTQSWEALCHSVQIALVGAGARRGGQMRRCGQRVIESASMLSKLRHALLLEGSGQRLSWAAEAWSEMHTRLWWSWRAAGRNALGLGARLE